MIARSVLFVVFLFSVSLAFARPWNDHANHLNILQRQIEMGENEIRALVDEKQHTSDPQKIAHIMRQIAERNKALQKSTKDYEEERQHVRFEHPEKNDQLNRTYVRHETKSLEDMENELGIDARLDRIKLRVLATFPIPEKKVSAEEKKFRTRLPASKPEVPDEDAPEKIILAK